MKKMFFPFLAVLLWAMSAHAQVQMFLRIPGIPGEAQAQGYEDTIEILSFSFSLTGPPFTGGGGASGPADLQPVQFSKLLDKASPLLMLKCAQGATIGGDTILTCLKSGPDQVLFYKITLKAARITAVSVGGSAGSTGPPGESLAIDFDEIIWEYTPSIGGGQQGKPITHRWNKRQNTGS